MPLIRLSENNIIQSDHIVQIETRWGATGIEVLIRLINSITIIESYSDNTKRGGYPAKVNAEMRIDEIMRMISNTKKLDNERE